MSPQNSYIDEREATLDYAPLSEEHAPAFAFSLIEVFTQLARRKQTIAKGAGVGMLTGVLLSLCGPSGIRQLPRSCHRSRLRRRLRC